MTFDPQGGPSGAGAFVIETDARDGLDGFWRRSFPVTGGRYYRFAVQRRATGIEWPQQCAPVTVQWLDADGKQVVDDRKLVEAYLKGYKANAPLEYPTEGATDKAGWTDVTGRWKAPSNARQAVVELHGRWAPNGRVEWSDVALDVTDAPCGSTGPAGGDTPSTGSWKNG